MNKNILIISASPRKGGNSDLLCDEFLRGATVSGNSAEKFFIADNNINYCTGCGVCNTAGKNCPQKDDMAQILEKMISSDVIVMATPVYFYTMDGQMKTFIDRTCARYTEITDKEFYFIMTAADSNVAELERTLEGFRGFTYCLSGAKEKGIVNGVGAWKIGEIKSTEAMAQAYQLGKNV